jgi:hypothetical protein
MSDTNTRHVFNQKYQCCKQVKQEMKITTELILETPVDFPEAKNNSFQLG